MNGETTQQMGKESKNIHDGGAPDRMGAAPLWGARSHSKSAHVCARLARARLAPSVCCPMATEAGNLEGLIAKYIKNNE